MLFDSVFQTFHYSLKTLNTEGPLSSYLCDILLPAVLITCQFLGLGINPSPLSLIQKRTFLRGVLMQQVVLPPLNINDIYMS